jgi:timeless
MTTHRTMTVDKQIVDELLLVCGVIGTTTKVSAAAAGRDGHDHHDDDDDNNQFTIVPVTDCVQWLQDLQRCLRRDDDVTRPISLLLHSWNIVVQKLLPLVYNTQYDTVLIITICKIIVLLTKPLHVQTIRAGRMMIHTKPSSSSSNISEA